MMLNVIGGGRRMGRIGDLVQIRGEITMIIGVQLDGPFPIRSGQRATIYELMGGTPDLPARTLLYVRRRPQPLSLNTVGWPHVDAELID
jgi:hypothetical protein